MPARNAAGSPRPPSAPSTRRARQGRPAAEPPRRLARASHVFPRIEARRALPIGKASLDCARLDDGRVVLLNEPARGLLARLDAEQPRRAARLRVEVVDEHGEVHRALDAAALIRSGVGLATGILLIEGGGTTTVASHEAAARFLDVLAELASAGLPRLLEAAS
ncbi:hypothetical protein [Sorangium cellulosum]|uniref:Uncharacterized protein n=1 Tax=Sorangium cellulosum TaxID=56 RepID=A0A150QG50_SORCE|nr:hypothetical protein [Sorangium cellulosum]KYF66852.1 hypothetical protein BE15_39125 [Sorangium cellulosum]